ncbi:MAG TPA: peptidoglycan-binding domain-containing protein, partial [Candidatus Paceibacterota bacterium]|nr:peptidoglycan-binding domain-containing protein [Candidatus Paceibacterota bacterium]
DATDHFGAPIGTFPTATFTAPLSINTNILTDVPGQDAQCITYDNLPIGRYYYAPEEISNPAAWETPRYYDRGNTPQPSTDLTPYSGELFDEDNSNDVGIDDDQSDGNVLLTNSQKFKTIIILNQMKKQEEGGGDDEDDTATISATKIVCDDESYLPNWGLDSDNPTVTATTAADFLAAGNNAAHCHLQKDWKFEWAPSIEVNPGNNLEAAGGAWTASGVTAADGTVSITVPVSQELVWFREQLKPDYIPFTGQTTDLENPLPSAEIHCNTDSLNYDNYEWIAPLEAGSTYHCVAFNVPVKKTASVNLCKVDEQQVPLAGWTLLLKGESVQEGLAVPTNLSAGIDSNPLAAGVSYIADVVGTWLNQGGANPADAEYSTIDGWTTQMDGYTGYQDDILELQIANTSGNWGTYTASHAYARSFTPALDGGVNFRIFDGEGTTQYDGTNSTPDWFGDNLGSLLVNIAKGHSGITGENGCVQLSDVAYGDYSVDEVMKDGWQNVSGLGAVTVDEPEETFTVVNKPVEQPKEDATIVATKIVCESETDLPNWGATSNDPLITATTAADFLATHPNCHLQKDWKFEWAPEGTANPGDNIIGTAGAPWTESGVTAVDGTVSISVPSGSDNLIWVREQMQPGYIPFTGSADDASNVSAELHCNTDGLHYDNVEWISPRAPGETYYCVGFNVPKKATLSVTKIVCPSEADLPNQGLEGGPLVTNTTAAEFLTAHPTCSLQPDWSFEWAPNGTPNPGDNIIGAAGAPWSILGVTDGTGTFTAEVPVGDSLVWVRENLKDGYIPFTGVGPDVSNVSAEFTCHTDGLHYDNYEWIGALEEGKTYHCVAYNVPKEQPPVDICPNIQGVQTILPDGYVLNEQGQCVPRGGGEGEDTEETIVVDSNNQNGWVFMDDNNSSILPDDYVAGPGTAPFGDGSAHLAAAVVSDRDMLIKGFTGFNLDDITELSYRTYQASTSGAPAIALQFNIDDDTTDLDNSWKGRLVYEPYYTHTIQVGSWQTWNTMDNSTNGSGDGNWWFSNGTLATNTGCAIATPCTWAEVLAALPNAGLHSAFGAVLFKVGGGWTGFDGNIDGFIIGIQTGINTATTTYDFEPLPPEPLAACANGVDDDSDGKIDFGEAEGNDPGCSSAEDDDETNAVPTFTSTSNENNSNSGGSSGSVAHFSSFLPIPQVLGASTEACEEYIKTYIKLGAQNDSGDVTRLQTFLNEHLGLSLIIDGIYGLQSFNAVKVFQKKYLNEVLTPWVPFEGPSVENGTGYVYKTTKRWINMLKCPDLNLPVPQLP